MSQTDHQPTLCEPPVGDASVTACHECDTLQRVTPPPPGCVSRCVCCGAVLQRNPLGGIESSLALALSALMFFIVSNFLPFITLKVQGDIRMITLTEISLALYREGMELLAAIVGLTSIVVPGLSILVLFYILAALQFSLRLPGLRPLLAGLSWMTPWGMMDVFLLGVLVALVKLVGMASIIPGAGLYSFVLLILLFIGALSRLDMHQLWGMLERLSRP